jgi:polar amino acid transport system substrate-binding protein
VISIRTLFALIALCACQNCAAIETITLAVENSWPPYSDNNGNGISKDIIQAAYDSVNVNVKFITVPYARAIKMAELGQVDGAFNVTKQKSTMGILNFGEIPILQATASFYYNNDSEMNFNSVNEIPNKTSVGIIIGYEYSDQFEKNRSRFNEIKVNNQTQLIKLLRTKRIDVAIMFDEVAKSKLDKMGLNINDIKKGKINHKSDIYVAFSKLKDTNNAIKLLDKGLTNIKKKVILKLMMELDFSYIK